MTKQLCGCGKHPLDASDEIAIYKGKCWSLFCLCADHNDEFLILLDKYEKTKDAYSVSKKLQSKFVKMKNYIRQQPCYICANSVGNRWVFFRDEIICRACHREMSLEGKKPEDMSDEEFDFYMRD